MPYFLEGKYAGCYLASEANGERSRDVVVLAQQQTLTPAATILGVITASGKATPVNPAAQDGSQTAKMILYDNVDATAGDIAATVSTRDCELNGAELIYPAGSSPQQIAAINTQLLAVDIIVRQGSV